MQLANCQTIIIIVVRVCDATIVVNVSQIMADDLVHRSMQPDSVTCSGGFCGALVISDGVVTENPALIKHLGSIHPLTRCVYST